MNLLDLPADHCIVVDPVIFERLKEGMRTYLVVPKAGDPQIGHSYHVTEKGTERAMQFVCTCVSNPEPGLREDFCVVALRLLDIPANLSEAVVAKAVSGVIEKYFGPKHSAARWGQNFKHIDRFEADLRMALLPPATIHKEDRGGARVLKDLLGMFGPMDDAYRTVIEETKGSKHGG